MHSHPCLLLCLRQQYQYNEPGASTPPALDEAMPKHAFSLTSPQNMAGLRTQSSKTSSLYLYLLRTQKNKKYDHHTIFTFSVTIVHALTAPPKAQLPD